MSNSERILSNNQKITDNNTDLETIITRIKQIPAPLDTSDATATADDILKDKTAYVDGEKITGTLEVNLQDKEVEITENGETEITADEGYDGLGKINVTTNVQSGGGSSYTGHYDVEGLKAIGWTDEEINYYQQNGVVWNEKDDESFKLTERELIKYDETLTRFLPKSSTTLSFGTPYKVLMAIPEINVSNLKNMNAKFQGCYSLITIPKLNTAVAEGMLQLFQNCYSLIKIPLLNTSNVTNMSYMFHNCCSLKEIPQLDMSKVTDTSYMFYYCYSLKTVPKLNTSKVTNMYYMFNYCYALTSVGEIDMSSVISLGQMFGYCYSLVDLKGFKNLGQAYLTSSSANYSSYTLSLKNSMALTHDSLMNVINNLYDIASKGCNAQKLELGTINLAKLTNEEKAIATTKRMDFKLKNKRRKLK